MKHLSNLLHKLTMVAAVAVTLTSCNRAEYAVLPKTSSYHGSAAQRPVASTPAAPEEAAALTPETAPVAPAAPAVAAPAAAAQLVVAAAPTVSAPVASALAPKVQSTQRAKVETKAPKLSFVQKAMVNKVLKKADKLAGKMQLKPRTEVAATKRLEGKLRQGLILLLVGILLSLFSGLGTIGAIIGVIGGIIFLIGAVLIIIYLLDEL